MRLKSHLLVIGLCVLISVAGNAQTLSLEKKPTDSSRYSLVKISVLPLANGLLREVKSYHIVLHYESQFSKESNFTYSMVAGYEKWQDLDGYALRLRPQVRYYIGKKAYNGFYAGAFPMYTQVERAKEYGKGNYYGGGLTVGYQYMINMRIPIEINFTSSYSSGRTKLGSAFFAPGAPASGPNDVSTYGIIELNIGLPIKKKQE